MNQSANNRADRTGGGDVTKAEELPAPTVDITIREDYAGSHGVVDNAEIHDS
jgi:hypothetical protein